MGDSAQKHPVFDHHGEGRCHSTPLSSIVSCVKVSITNRKGVLRHQRNVCVGDPVLQRITYIQEMTCEEIS